jgi:DNA-binding NarL/FixJ family response regulator
MTKPRIVLVDDHEILRAGAAKYLAEAFDVVGEASDVQEAIDLIVSLEPDGVLLDVHLPSGSGAEVVRGVRVANVACRFVCLSVSADRRDVLKMLQEGIDGYLVKSTDACISSDRRLPSRYRRRGWPRHRHRGALTSRT